MNSGTRPWTQLFCLSAHTISWSWILIGRTDAEAEAPILWSPDVKSWLIGKDPDTGKDRGQKKGMRCWMVSLTQWTCVCVCVCVWVTQLCLTPCDPMDCSLPGSSVHGICQARVLEWGAIAFSLLPYTGPLILWSLTPGPSKVFQWKNHCQLQWLAMVLLIYLSFFSFWFY